MARRIFRVVFLLGIAACAAGHEPYWLAAGIAFAIINELENIPTIKE